MTPEEQWALEEEGEWCYIHGHEPPGDYQFLVCGECYHCYPTPEDLVNDFNAVMKAGWEMYESRTPYVPEVSISNIHFCPHCAHDF